MRHARRTILALATVLAASLAVPGGTLAADSVTLTGTVVRDGAPVPGVGIVVTATGSDLVVSGATNEQGAFAVELEAGIGAELQVYATGQTVRTGPDAQGCVRSETLIGYLTTTIEALPPAPIEVPLDQVLSSSVCSATATPQVTPPATDAAGGTAGGPGAALLVVLGMLLLVSGGSLALAPRRARR